MSRFVPQYCESKSLHQIIKLTCSLNTEAFFSSAQEIYSVQVQILNQIVSSLLEHQISCTVFLIFWFLSRTKDGSEFLFHAKDEVRNSILICLTLFSSSDRLSDVCQYFTETMG